MAKFCGKCGARLDEQTGRCPACDPTAAIINAVRSRAEEETVAPESSPVRQSAAQPQGRPVQRAAYCARYGVTLDAWGRCPACGWTAVSSVQQTVERTVNGDSQNTRYRQDDKETHAEPEREDRTTRSLKRAICIVAALIVLLAVGTGVLVYLDVLDVPPVAKFYDAIGLKPYANSQNGGTQDQPQQDTANSGQPSGTGQDDAAVQAPYTQQRLELVSSGSRGTLTLSEWQEDGTWRELCVVMAYLGENGVTWNKRDGDKATPAGEFDILYYIGINDRGSKLKYVPISDGDVWVCDPNSLHYNTMQRNSGTRDWDAAQAENLYRKFHDDYSAACIMFNYNGDGLRSDTAASGKGSDIFIDGVGSKGNLTSGYGDIKITANDMLTLLDYLDSDKHPTLTVS